MKNLTYCITQIKTMKKLFLILSILIGLVASAQYQPINRPLQYVNTFGYQYERFHSMYLMGLPADTFAVPALLQNIPFIANKAGSIYNWNITTHVWDLFSSGGGSVETASNGLYKSSNDIRLGSPFGSATPFTENRVVDLGERQLHFAKDYVPLVGDTTNTHLRLTVIDTVYANSLPSSVIKTAASSFNRIFRVTGNFANQFKVGHATGLEYQFGDTARVLSMGGDFGGASYNALYMGYLPSFTTGRSAIQGGVVDFESTYANLGIVQFSNSSSSRHIKYNGWVSVYNAVLRMTNFPDTISNLIFYNAHAFQEAAAVVLKGYNFYPNYAGADSNWSWHSKIPTNHFYQEGSVTIGGGHTSSPYKLRVHGDSYFYDSVYLNTAREISDTTGMDVVLRKRSDGALVRIRADLLGGGGSQTLQQVFTTGSTLTGNNTIANDYVLSITGNSAVAFGDILSVTNSSTTGRALNLQSAGTNATIQAVNTKTTSGGGSAIYASAVGSNAAASLNRDSSSTATVVKVLDINRTTSGTAADGIGASIHFNIENQSGSGFYANSIESIWKNSIDASKESMLRIRGVDNVVEKVFMDIQKGGIVIVNDGADTLANLQDVRDGGGGGGTPALTQYRLAIGDASNLLSTNAAITASRVLVSDANGVPVAATPTTTEINRVAGVTSDIQTQLDAKVDITTVSPAHTGITPTGTGIIPVWYPARVPSDFTMVNSNTVQPAFPTTIDVWTLQGNTTYYFRGSYIITSGSTSHSVGMSFALGGGASLTRINYTTLGKQSGTATGTPTMQTVSTNANTAATTAATTGLHTITFEGWITINAGGTVTPSVTFSADPTGTILMKTDSWIMFTPVGDGSFVSAGPVN